MTFHYSRLEQQKVQEKKSLASCTVPARLVLSMSKKDEDSTNEKCTKKVLCMVSQKHLLFVCIAKRPLRAFAFGYIFYIVVKY